MWFKKQQKKAGVTTADIARHIGRDRTIISHIYNGRQRMSLDWAKAFAETLNVSIDEVLEKAGALEAKSSTTRTTSISDGDLIPYSPPSANTAQFEGLMQNIRNIDDIQVWKVTDNSLELNGFMPGDLVFADRSQSELCRAGDFVVAKAHDRNSGTDQTILRRFEPPALVAASTDPSSRRIHIVDGNNVLILGKIVASWRSLT